MANTSLKGFFYQTDNNAEAGEAFVVLSGPDQSANYEADVKSLHINNQSPFTPELIKGRGNKCDGVLNIQLYTSQRNDLKMLLVQNPLEPRVSFTGSAAYGNGIYNLNAVVA